MKIFLFLKDYTENDQDLYFIWSNGILTEILVKDLVQENDELICHDFWLIAPSIYRQAKKLPNKVIDLIEFYIAITGCNEQRMNKEKNDFIYLFGDTDIDQREIQKYQNIFYKKEKFDKDVYKNIGTYLDDRRKALFSLAQKNDELRRQEEIEIPVFNILNKHVINGIFIDKTKLKKHKQNIDYKFFKCLKEFSHNYNLPLEVPCDDAIVEYLEPMGYDFSNDSIEYVLKYSSFKDNFSEDLQELQDLDRNRSLLKSLPVSKNAVVPIINTFGSITSRIYYKDPLLQNLSKKHRDIIKPQSSSKKLSYIDYDQFEVGIMAALSKDPILLKLYNEEDIYLFLSKTLFDSEHFEDRKFAKNLFLAFSYGMSSKRLGDAVHEKGGNRKRILEFFKSLDTFNKWKLKIQNEFLSEGKIGTCLGNYLIRSDENFKTKKELSKKEERSCISQIVQG